jgi:optic atrophy 3 protein
LAEGFLFAVAAALILAETYRSSRSSAKRRDDVDEQLEELSNSITELSSRVDAFIKQAEEGAEFERQKHDELSRILERVVEIGLRGGWAEFEQDPIKLPKTSLTHLPPKGPFKEPSSSSKDDPPNDASAPPPLSEPSASASPKTSSAENSISKLSSVKVDATSHDIEAVSLP